MFKQFVRSKFSDLTKQKLDGIKQSMEKYSKDISSSPSNFKSTWKLLLFMEILRHLLLNKIRFYGFARRQRDFVCSRMEIFLMYFCVLNPNLAVKIVYQVKDKWIKNIDFCYIFQNISRKVRFFSVFLSIFAYDMVPFLFCKIKLDLSA